MEPITLEVEVTNEHIANGTPGCNASCPLALAYNARVAPDYNNGRITGYKKGDFHQRFKGENGSANNMPFAGCMIWDAKATEFVRRFDRGESVEPGVFTITLWENGHSRPVV